MCKSPPRHRVWGSSSSDGDEQRRGEIARYPGGEKLSARDTEKGTGDDDKVEFMSVSKSVSKSDPKVDFGHL